jgi:hypothetical protein
MNNARSREPPITGRGASTGEASNNPATPLGGRGQRAATDKPADPPPSPHHSGASHRRAPPDPCRGRPDPRAGWSDPRRKRAPPAGAAQERPLPSGQRETPHHTHGESAGGGDGCGGGPHTQRSASPPPEEHGDRQGRPCPSLVELPSMVCMRERAGSERDRKW